MAANSSPRRTPPFLTAGRFKILLTFLLTLNLPDWTRSVLSGLADLS